MKKEEIDNLIKSLDKEQQEKLMNALSNKAEAQRILASPQAQEIMKKLMGEK